MAKNIKYFLANAPKPWILSQFLRLAQNETIIRSQDYFTTLRYIASNPIGIAYVIYIYSNIMP